VFQQLITFVLQLRADSACDSTVVRQRDRAVGQSLVALRGKPIAQLNAWLQQVARHDTRTLAHQVVHARRVLSLLVLLAGLIAGNGTAALVFSYDGTQPINVLPVLSAFVLLPLVLLVFLGMRALLGTLIPLLLGRSGLQPSLSLWFAALMALLQRLLPQQYREAMQLTLGWSRAHYRLYGRVYRWSLLTWSQVFALGFQLSAIAWFVFRLSTTDMAFVWSTTLDIEPQTMAAITNSLALPWTSLAPQATTDLDTIRHTRYFRAHHWVVPPNVHAEALGRWWPFVLAAMITYGVVPRLLTLLLCLWRQRVALRWCLVHTPGATEVLDRLNSPIVETAAADAMAPSPDKRLTPVPDASAMPRVPASLDNPISSSQAMVIIWANVPVRDSAVRQHIMQHLDVQVTSIWPAGGATPPEEDQWVLHAAAEARRDRFSTPRALLMLVKAWEPPMLEVVDFLCALRRAIGEGARIVVLPIAMSPQALAAHVYQQQCAVWQRKLATVGDPWLRVQSLPSLVAQPYPGGEAR
jgi:uncharacterized protein DUF2868